MPERLFMMPSTSIPLSQSEICWLRSAEESGQERDEGDADEGDTAAGHQLLHALGLWLCEVKK